MSGQLLKPGQKNVFSANFGAKIEVRPTLRPGQSNGARPGFIVCLLDWHRGREVYKNVIVNLFSSQVYH